MPDIKRDPKHIEIEERTTDETRGTNQVFFSRLPSDKIPLIKRSKKQPGVIIHPVFQNVLDEMRLVLETAGSSKPKGLLIVGNSDSGKSTVLRRFRKELEEEMIFSDPERNIYEHEREKPLQKNAIKPAVFFSIPSGLTGKGILKRIMSSNGILVKESKTLNELEDTLYDRLTELKTRVILIDEFHDINGVPTNYQDEVLKILKEMTNNLSIPIIAAGTKEAVAVVNSDEQMMTRFKRVDLMPLDRAKDFRDFMVTYEAGMDFKLKHSIVLNNKEFFDYFYNRSGGLAGQAAELFHEALEYAIEHDKDKITKEVLEKISFKSLIKRIAERPDNDMINNPFQK